MISSVGFTLKVHPRRYFHFAPRRSTTQYKPSSFPRMTARMFWKLLVTKSPRKATSHSAMQLGLLQERIMTIRYPMLVRTRRNTVTYSRAILFILALLVSLTHCAITFKLQSTCFSMEWKNQSQSSQKLSQSGLCPETTLKRQRRWQLMQVSLPKKTLTWMV